ncbi:MAG: arginase family protein [Anaerolineae bacterium]|nr:arginase family protein [Anaerolineae bacterium]
MTDFVCIGVPYSLGEKLDERNEVAAVRDSGLAQAIGATWVDITPDFAASLDPVTAVNRALAHTIIAHRDRVPLILAGDCTSAIGAAKGLLGDDGLGVVWLDAHGDFNTPETSPSGFLGGMPLAMLAGRGEQHLMAGVELPPLSEKNIVLTDARDLDPGEAASLKTSAVTHLPDIHDLLTAPLPSTPIYVHLDVDVVNPDEMPGMSYPAPGGPSLEETAAVIKRVARDGHVIGLLVGLWNEDLVSDDRALQGTLKLMRAFVDAVQA